MNVTRLIQAMAASVALSLAAGSGAAIAGPPVVAITGATIFDATGREPFTGTVLIAGERILDVGPKLRIPKGATVIRAKGKALLPGFLDLHTHWTPVGSPATTPQIASAYIANGVTTVADFHQQPESFAPRRAWLRDLFTPHVRFVARMSTPGGHGADWGDTNTTKWVSTPESARLAVRALQPYQPDHIKAFTDGWRYGTLPEETSMNVETLSALVDEAHRFRQQVLTHTVTVARGRIAATAGVDAIAHSLQDQSIDSATIAMLKQAGTIYAPTLAVYEPVKPGQAAPADRNDPAVRQRFAKWEFARQNLRALYEAGVTVALGTDAGMPGTPHGTSTLREMELMVDAGLPAKAALLAGTANTALALGLADDRGTIARGKRADLVLIDGRPWQTIADVHKIDRVFIDGRLVHGGGVKLPAANSARYLPALPAAALIDDFERGDGRSSLDTLRLLDMDGGVDRSVVVSTPIARPGGGNALLISSRMSLEEKPQGGVLVPLSRGSVQPADARAYRGVRLSLRGDGPYQLVVNTLSGQWTADVSGNADWQTIEVPFTAFRQTRGPAATWSGDDLLQVGLQMRREAAASDWAEIDDLGFFR